MEMSECSVDDCHTRTRKAGSEHCEKHYYRLRRTGTLDLIIRPKKPKPEPKPRIPKSPRECSVPECNKRARCKGLCNTHDSRVRRYGTLEVTGRRTPPRDPQEILDGYLPDRPDGECWEWRGGISKDGYGVIHRAGKRRLAHRFTYEQLVGDIPRGKLLRHSCDNPPCCNPEHLTPGTNADNSRDMIERDRSPRGSRHPNARVTEAMVVEMRRKHSDGATMTELARQYGVSLSTASRILRRAGWRHVPEDEAC